MPNQFLSPEGDLENYFLTEYWLIDQYVGDELWNWGYAGPNLFIYNVDSFPSVPGSSYGATFNGDNTSITKSIPVTTFAGGNNWKQIDFGSAAASIKTDGTLWVWGTNDYGVLGTFDTAYKTTPVTTFAGGTNWKQVSSGGSVIAAIKTDGTLWTWGLNTFGQLGDNTTTQRITPVTTFAGGSNWKQISTGNYHSAAIKTDGTLWTWGLGNNGQLGNRQTVSISGSMTNQSNILTTSNTSGVVVGMSVISTSPYNGAMLQLGTVTNVSATTITFTNNYPPSVVSAVGTWDDFYSLSTSVNYSGIVQPGDTVASWNPSSPAPSLYTVSSVSADRITFNEFAFGYNFQTYTVTFQRTIGNFSGTVVLGFSSYSGAITPVTTFVGGTNWKQVSGGDSHTAAIKTDGTLWTWGSGVSLGDNTGITRYTPVTTFAGGTNWKQVVCGSNNTAAIKTDGTLWTWGYNYYGQLGNNTNTNRSTPVTTFVGGSNWKQVACGRDHTAAIKTSDDLQGI